MDLQRELESHRRKLSLIESAGHGIKMNEEQLP